MALMQETPADRLLPAVVERISGGTDLRQLVAAAALANARTFGGQDYDGYHAIMALAPAYQMSHELPEPRRALPVMKVLYRNTNHIQQMGGATHEALHAVEPADLPAGQPGAEALREATRRQDMEGAERAFAALAQRAARRDCTTISSTSFRTISTSTASCSPGAPGRCSTSPARSTPTPCSASRCVSASMRRAVFIGTRTAVKRSCGPCCRSCSTATAWRRAPRGTRSRTMPGSSGCATRSTPPAESKRPRRSPWPWPRGSRPRSWARRSRWPRTSSCSTIPVVAGKTRPRSRLGASTAQSVGVHASDAANAWRNIARVSDRRNTYASLIVGAYHTAGQAAGLNPKPYPFAEHSDKVRSVAPDDLLHEAEAAIKANDQARACALVHRYGELGRPARPAFDLLLRYAIIEDGALHAEKYYRTVTEEFATTRPAFRWRQLAALARVTASEHGYPAPGVAEARRLLKVDSLG